MMSTQTALSVNNFSSFMAASLGELEKAVQSAPQLPQAESDRKIGYLDTLFMMHGLTLPLFQRISQAASQAGFTRVEPFTAFPKGQCENFVFAEINGGQYTRVCIAKNIAKGFLQNGGGKTPATETSAQAALREAQEEFGFTGAQSDIKQLTIESVSNIPTFHFVKGVHIINISPEGLNALKLGSDMGGGKNALHVLSVADFLRTVDQEKQNSPKDHAIDRQWIAKYLRGEPGTGHFLHYGVHEITENDCEVAKRESGWMATVGVSANEIESYREIVKGFANAIAIDAKDEGKEVWTGKKRDEVKQAAQKVVDAIVSRLLGQISRPEKTCHVKVQEAAGVCLNGAPIPSFMTIPSMLAMQHQLPLGKKYTFEVVDVQVTCEGAIRNVITGRPV